MSRRKHTSDARIIAALAFFIVTQSAQGQGARPRARELGVAPGIFQTGARNAITDVQGVTVGQVTMVEWLLERPNMEQVRSINPVVGETNDGILNAVRSRPIRAEHVRRALESAG